MTQQEMVHPSYFYFDGKFTQDIIYAGFNVQFFIKFLISIQKKANNKLVTFGTLRKYKDAVQWGSDVRKEPLPTIYYRDIKEFLKGYKTQTAQAKKNGQLDERAADPITIELYKLILTWAIENNNIFVWFWTVAQWNNMARAANIDPLCFHNFSLGTDTIVCKYDDSKADKDGEKLSEKNIYANPFDMKMCFWTAMGVYCCLNSERLATSEKLFVTTKAKEKSAKSKYQEQLMGILKNKEQIVANHMRFDRANGYSLRKGSATHATSGTTCPPPIPSIARRGEWSMGAVLDVYWHFAEPGDFFLGRILMGADPNKEDFGTLPPHWTMIDPLSNADVKEAASMCFGNILKNYEGKPEDPTALLLRTLAAIVFNSDAMLDILKKYPSHDFGKIALLHNRDLLSKLKKLVTTDPTDGVMTNATGIPPHVELAIKSKV